MATILNVPAPTKAPRQKAIDVSDLFLTRFTPPWSRPASLPAMTWRMWVLNQPVAIVCRETLIANLLSLDWKITPRNSKYKEELEPTIKHYTKVLTNGGEYPGLGLDFSGMIEWIVGDLLDIPFGGAAEIGRKGGSENGRVQWIRPLDGGTLYPTLNQDFPIVQYYPNYSNEIVTFKPWEISRTYMSPHSFILREGWGMAPPEKVYFALDLLTKGDKYYANLLLDIPTSGVLDLGDMEKGAAEEWITAFKSFVNDQTTSFKIPVLYEHNNKVEFIPFGKVPNDIMFNHITLKYAALVAASYGMSLSDIGLQTTTASGETLAGSIRQERRTRKTGMARIKAKMKSFFDHILPETLEFNWVDYDDELNVAMGRARLGTSQAFKTAQDQGWFSAQELRSQWIQDGLSSISMPDEIPPDAKPLLEQQQEMGAGPFAPKQPFGKSGGNKEPELVKSPKAPSGGGEGDVGKAIHLKLSTLDTVSFKSKPRNLQNFVVDVINKHAGQYISALGVVSEDEIEMWKSIFLEDIETLDLGQLPTKPLGTFSIGEELRGLLGDRYDTFKSNLESNISDFVARSVLINVLMSDAEPEELVSDVMERLNKSLTDYVSIYVRQEFEGLGG